MYATEQQQYSSIVFAMKIPLLTFFQFLPLLLFSAPSLGRDSFNVWATSCAHASIDAQHRRESLGRSIRQSEGETRETPGFDWDIMIDAGDLSASQFPPTDREGATIVEQYARLKKHRREQIYNVSGNHDAAYFDETPGRWFRKWADPLGENTAHSGVDPGKRPYLVEGNWERYKFRAGNILFLMLSDRNDLPSPVGRGYSRENLKGGNPPGAVTRETFDWWKQQVLENQDKIIITMAHHVLRDTTTGSGRGEGSPRYHGNSPQPEGSSYLYYLVESVQPDRFLFTEDTDVFARFLEDFESQHGYGAIDLWIGGHTHVKGPDDSWGGKTITETVWGVNFVQTGALTQYHGNRYPMSRVIGFVAGKDQAVARVFLHEAGYRSNPVGFYDSSERTLMLRHRFEPPASESNRP